MKNDTLSSRATELLCAAHEEVRVLLGLLRDSAAANGERKRELIADLAAAIRAHGRMERDVFYPAVVEGVGEAEGRALLAQALVEHERAEHALTHLEGVDPTSMGFRRALRALADATDDHANHQESLVFPRVRHALHDDRLRELGARMEPLRAPARETLTRSA